MEDTIACVLDDLSSLKDESCCSLPFTVAGYNWRLGVYFEGDDRYLYVFLQIPDTASLSPGWSRDVKFSFTLVDNEKLNVESDEGLCCFTKEANTWGFKYYFVHDKSEDLEFLMNKRLHIIAYLQFLPAVVVPVESVKIIEEEHQASDAFIEDSSCQVEQETENASKENLDGDDETSDEGTDDDDNTSEEGTDDNDEDTSDEDTNDDDDPSDEGTDDDDGTSDDGSWEDVGQNDDTTEESSEDDDSKDDARDVTFINKGTETTNDLLEEIQGVEEINGFEVSSSQVESVCSIFERHLDIAIGFRPKNQEIRTAYMNGLLSLIETLCKSQEKLSLDDLSKAEETLCDLTDVGLKLDWLKTKVNEVYEMKKKQEGSGAKMQTMEEELQKLKLMVLDLETQLQNAKAEALAARNPLSFDDVI